MKQFYTGEKKRYIIIFISLFIIGAFSIVGFAPFRYYYLMPIFLLALIYTLSKYPQWAVSFTYAWALGLFSSHCYWVNIAINVFGGVPKILAIPISFLLAMYLAIFPMLAVWGTKFFKVPQKIQLILILPMCWVLLEFVRERLFTGFGWGTLGYSQAIESPLIGYAVIGGILLSTYAVVQISVFLYYLLTDKTLLKKTISLIGIFLILAFGQIFKSIDFTHPDGTAATIGIVQPNISQDVKFNYDSIAQSMRKFQHIIASHPELDIIFFPETSVPISWESLTVDEKRQFVNLSQQNETSIALGIFKDLEPEQKFYNAVIGIDPLNEKDNLNDYPFYAKSHLVPFGEYKPLPKLSELVFKLLNLSMGELSRGPANQYLIHLSNQKIAFNICYEEGFGDELIALGQNASLIANATNMAWYGSSYAMDLQLQQGQARAIELGRFVVRATNTGYSAIINNKGKIIESLPRDQEGLLVGQIQGYEGNTPYMKMGGSFYWIALLFLILLVIFSYTRIRKFNP